MANDSKISDANAKKKFIDILCKEDFELANWKEEGIYPADIYVRSKTNDEYYFFEIKMTSIKDGNYFGGATLTEWEAAAKYSKNYFFVIAFSREKGKDYDFYIISPKNFLKYSYIPPFKIYFNIPFRKEENKKKFYIPGRKKGSLLLSSDSLNSLSKSWNCLKEFRLKDRHEKTEAEEDEFLLIDPNQSLFQQISGYHK